MIAFACRVAPAFFIAIAAGCTPEKAAVDAGGPNAVSRRTCLPNVFGPDCIGDGVQNAMKSLGQNASSGFQAALDGGSHSRAASPCKPFDANDAVQWPLPVRAAQPPKLDALLQPGLGSSHETEPQRGRVGLERLAEAADGRVLVVLRSPWSRAPFDAVRVFFGQLHALQERQLLDFQVARDGGSTRMKFKVGEDDATASFTVCRAGDGHQIRQGCPATLRISALDHSVRQLTPEREALKRARFLCGR